MKKILGFLFAIVILGCGGYFVYVNYIKSKVPKLNLEEEVSNASKYYVYGNHFNIEVDGSNPLKVYKEVVSVKNLEVSETVYFDEIVMGKAILRRAKETKADGTIVDKGLDIFVV